MDDKHFFRRFHGAEKMPDEHQLPILISNRAKYYTVIFQPQYTSGGQNMSTSLQNFNIEINPPVILRAYSK